MRILITGAAGFTPHHVVKYFLDETDWDIVALDCLNYASFGWDRLRNIGAIPHDRLLCLSADFSQPITPGVAQEIDNVEIILHMGAETHVDNSIVDAVPFIKANVLGTYNMMEFARTLPNLKQFIYFSTDEVFGFANEGARYEEWDRYNSTNPYAATKAGGEEIALAHSNTHDIPLLIIHCCNTFGERQHPEKYIPMATRLILNRGTVMINADRSLKNIGSRFYLYCVDLAEAILHLINRGPFEREKINIAGAREVDNLEVARLISEYLNCNLDYKIVDPDIGRHSHDLRYELDCSKLKLLGWTPPENFEEKLEDTIKWYADNPEWLF